MTVGQSLALLIIVATMGLFVWGRLRYDLVALLSLLAAALSGIVPAKEAFSGFGSDIVVIIGSALLISAAISRSGFIDLALRPVEKYVKTPASGVLLLTASVALLSAFVKNIGALAMLMPAAFQIAKRTGSSPSLLLMPMAFASLLGGTITLIGTSPNVIVSQLRTDLVGAPFRMFDYAPVGIGVTLLGVAFLAFGYRLLPVRKGAASIDAAFNISGYVTEVGVPKGSPMLGKPVSALEELVAGEISVSSVIRGRLRRYAPAPETTLREGDLLLLEGEPAALEKAVVQGGLRLVEETGKEGETGGDRVGVVEAVITADSPLIDRGANFLASRYDIGLLAVSRSGKRQVQRVKTLRLKAGDVIVLQGDLDAMPEALGELHCLPLAERNIALGRNRSRYVPPAILAIAMVLIALEVVSVAVGFLAAAVAMLLARSLSAKEAYDAIDWPLLIMIGGLIPVSDALQSTGLTDLVAGGLSSVATALPAHGALALILVAGMAVTPFLNNAATVLVMAPIAAKFATDLGYNPDPFLMAVALGAASDFLTPIGHQCNTLVMGPGGYRFGDYARLGLPLSVMIVVVGVVLIGLVWPLR